MLIQLDFFKSDIDIMREEFDKVKGSADRVRKKLFAENGKHAKIIEDLSRRMEIIERHICLTDKQ